MSTICGAGGRSDCRRPEKPIAIGFSGRLQSLRPPAPQIVLIVLSAIAILVQFVVPSVREWAARVDLRGPVAFHLTRFVGLYFLYLCGRGELARDFAVPAGYGDLAVAVLAIAVIATGSPTGSARYVLWRIWNLLGLIDILLVVQTAWRIGTHDPASMAALLRMPLALLVPFVVPVIIASHVL